MSRYGIEVEREGWTDREADIGYDPMLGTYFLQAFREGPDGHPTVWLGLRAGQFPSLAALLEVAAQKGCTVLDLEDRVIAAMEIEATEDAEQATASRL